jgi:hypothetical protein
VVVFLCQMKLESGLALAVTVAIGGVRAVSRIGIWIVTTS